ncbi:SulP family inorganic anion transporter [Methylibium sp.]|uniref:SulP family inorganic anion transporter n=1 Tax=Methylibium sp. TaxID=2067992 RepID=UPI003D0AF78F
MPFLAWPRPTRDSLRKDVWAGVSVALLLIPQSIAYAALAGMPPETGLYAAMLPAVVGILWGSSPLLAVGPVALTSLLTFASLQPLARPGSVEWVHLAVWLAIHAGAIQLALGALRLGAVAHFVSQPVVAGFVNAAALIILLSQLPALLGLPAPLDAAAWGRLDETVRGEPWRLLTTAAFGLSALAFLLLHKRRWPRVPGVLVVCAAGIGVSVATGFQGLGGAVVGAVPHGLPALGALPSIGLDQHRALLPAAVIVALISFTEALSSCRTLPRTGATAWDENQELIGQGLAKIASGASGAFPVSGSFSRSSLNVYVGATSGWSTLVCAACVTACTLWGGSLLSPLPTAVLAAIVIAPVLTLIDLRVFRRIWRVSRDDGVVAVLTFGATLATVPQLQWGVLAGTVASILCYLYRRSRPRIVEVGLHPDGVLRDRRLHGLPPVAPHVLAVRMDAGISYVTAPQLERFVTERLRQTPGTRTVLLCCSAINDIDATGVETLRAIHRQVGRDAVALHFSGVKHQVHQVLASGEVAMTLAGSRFFRTDREALEALGTDGPPWVASP